MSVTIAMESARRIPGVNSGFREPAGVVRCAQGVF